MRFIITSFDIVDMHEHSENFHSDDLSAQEFVLFDQAQPFEVGQLRLEKGLKYLLLGGGVL